MKKTLLHSIMTLGVLIVTLTTSEKVSAQSSTKLDTAIGGQLKATMTGQAVIATNDTIFVWKQWSFDSLFTKTYTTPVDTFMNDSIGGNDTAALNDTTLFPTEGVYWMRYLSNRDTTIGMKVLVDTIWTKPSIVFTSKHPNKTGGIQYYNWKSRGTKGMVYIWECPGDTTFTLANAFLMDSVPVKGQGTSNWKFTGFNGSPFYKFAYMFLSVNPAGRDSAIGWMITIDSIAAWNGQVYNPTMGTDSATFTVDVISGNATTYLTTHYGEYGQPLNDSVITKVGATNGVTPTTVKISGLKPGTRHQFVNCSRNSMGGMCSTDTFDQFTLNKPVVISAVIDTMYPLDGHKQRTTWKVVIPTGEEPCIIGTMLTSKSDLYFSSPLQYSTTDTIKNSGVFYIDFDYDGLNVGDELRIERYGVSLTTGNQLSVDTGVPFTFSVPTVKITKFVAGAHSLQSGGDSVTFTIASTGGTDATLSGGFGSMDPNGSITVFIPSSQRVTVTVTNTYGNTDTASDSITVAPDPIPNIVVFTADKYVLNQGESTIIRLKVKNGVDISIDNGIGIMGSNSYETVSPSVTTTYIATATNPFGTDTAGLTIVVLPTTGIKDITSNSTIALHPNPATGDVIFITNPDNARVDIYDISGQHVHSEFSQQIDISSLPSGLYVCRLKNYFAKFIVTH